MNLRLSPPCLLLSPNKLWVLWAAGSYTCFPLVFYCLTVRCSVGALGYFVFSFVSCLSPSMPCCAISEAVYCRARWCIIGVVGARLPLVSTRFPFASQVCSCDFVLWDRRLYFATTCLPLVYRFFFLSAEDLGPEYFLYCISYLSLICRLLLSLCCPQSGKHDLSTAEPQLSPTSVSVLRPLVSCLPSNFFDYFLSYMYMVSWQAPIRRLMFPSSVWAQRCITFVTCYLLLAGWNVWFRAAFVVAFLPCLSPTSDLCPSIFYHFLKLVSLRSCTPSTPHLCNMGGKDGRDFLQCNADWLLRCLFRTPEKKILGKEPFP